MRLVQRRHEFCAWADNGFFITWNILGLLKVQLGLHDGYRRWCVLRRFKDEQGAGFKLLHFGKLRADAPR